MAITAAALIGAQAAGSLIGGAFSAYGADKQAKAQKQMLEKQLAWERERATNAHTWEVEDLKKAGLNPVLSAQGQGASTSAITTPDPPYQAAYNQIGLMANEAVNNTAQLVMQNGLINKQLNQMEENIKTAPEQRKLIKAQQTVATNTANLIKEQTSIENYKKKMMNWLDPEERAMFDSITQGVSTLGQLFNIFNMFKNKSKGNGNNNWTMETIGQN